MKNEFKVGDEVRIKSDLKLGKNYDGIEALKSMIKRSGQKDIIKDVSDSGNYWLEKAGLYFSKDMLEEIHQVEYFSALNEKDAEKYIGRTMEFADRKEALKNVWERGIFTGRNSRVTDYSFGYGGYYWQFCRTCPETVQKKKIFERWINVYKDTDTFYNTREEADANAAEPRIDCIHIYKEYEVEE